MALVHLQEKTSTTTKGNSPALGLVRMSPKIWSVIAILTKMFRNPKGDLFLLIFIFNKILINTIFV